MNLLNNLKTLILPQSERSVQEHSALFHEESKRISRRMFVAGGLLATATAPRSASTQTDDNIALSFGIITDIHYAQLYSNSDRYYKGALQKVQDAMTAFTEAETDFIVELGDLISAGGDKKAEIVNLREIDTVYRTFPKKRYYVLGNHDLQCLTKKEFLNVVDQPKAQFSFDANGYHFIVLDACFNPDGSDYKNGQFDWTKSFIPQSSLKWLEKDLHSTNGRPVIVFLHQILFRDGYPHCVLNAPAVRAVLESHGNVRAVFQGHQHFSAHIVINGIHYISLAAVVSARPPAGNTYAVVKLYTNGSVLVDGINQRDYQWA
jgi:hypothetical protein